MAMYEIAHMDAVETMTVEAESPSKAKYKNYLAWSDAFNTDDFKGYIKGLIYCKKIKQSSDVPVITNADRIRAMSDEELAEMLWKTGRNYRVVCADPVVDHDEQCAELVKWLQQPVEIEEA